MSAMTWNPPEAEELDADLWGAICAEYAADIQASFVIRRDDGARDEMTPAVYFREELLPLERQALQRAHGVVLDVGCGPGRHVLALQRRGFTVIGIDTSPRTAEVARQRGCHDLRVLSLWDIEQLGQKFRSVFMLGNNAGLPGSLEEVGRFLALLRAYTEPDAVLIAQSIDPTDTDNPHHLEYHRRNERAGRYKGEVRIREEYKGRVSPWWNLVFMEHPVFQQACEDNGWQVEEIIAARPSYYLTARRAGPA